MPWHIWRSEERIHLDHVPREHQEVLSIRDASFLDSPDKGQIVDDPLADGRYDYASRNNAEDRHHLDEVQKAIRYQRKMEQQDRNSDQPRAARVGGKQPKPHQSADRDDHEPGLHAATKVEPAAETESQDVPKNECMAC
jgi:hypothetical protein